MGCCPTKHYTDEERFGVLPNTQCSAITVDMLLMFKKPIDCYVKHGLWGEVGSSEEEMNSAVSYLEGFIAQKQLDEENCEGLESLAIIRSIVDKIIKKGICL